MALFPSGDNASSHSEVETVIGPSVKVDGNFIGEGNVSVDGVVHGSLKTKHDLTVGPTAKIKAEVEAQNLFLAGEIKGNVKIIEKAQLSSSAKILGNLETKILSVEEGAVINGKCTMINEPPTPSDEKKPSK